MRKKFLRCSNINICDKVRAVMDKDLAGDWQYIELIEEVCRKCPVNIDKVKGVA